MSSNSKLASSPAAVNEAMSSSREEPPVQSSLHNQAERFTAYVNGLASPTPNTPRWHLHGSRRSTVPARRAHFLNSHRIISRQSVELIRGLSRSQIDAFNRVEYSAVDAAADDDVCSICLDSRVEAQRIVKLACAHKLHEQCAEAVFDTSTKCPVCRYEFYRR